jgi:hypothetical protein
VLTAQRDLRDARTALIDTKQQQLSAVVNAYQALGGGNVLALLDRLGPRGLVPNTHTVRGGEDFKAISQHYYASPRYHKALWAVNKAIAPDPARPAAGVRISVPRVDQLDPALIEPAPVAVHPSNDAGAAAEPAKPPPPPGQDPGPFAPQSARPGQVLGPSPPPTSESIIEPLPRPRATGMESGIPPGAGTAP